MYNNYQNRHRSYGRVNNRSFERWNASAIQFPQFPQAGHFQSQQQPNIVSTQNTIQNKVAESKDCFHIYQQFQHTMKAFEEQELDTHNQMSEFLLEQNGNNPNTVLPDIGASPQVAFFLNMYGNEFRYITAKVPGFGMKILVQLPLIHNTTGCNISLSDRVIGRDDEFTSIKISGSLCMIEKTTEKCLDLLPLHIGMHLSNLKRELGSVDLRKKLEEWMDTQLYKFTGISFYFVKDPHPKRNEQYSYVVLRGNRDNPNELMNATISFSELVFSKVSGNEFSAGYRLPVADRDWFLGIPHGSLVSAISTKSGTTIKYSNFESGKTMDYNIFGRPEALIEAEELLRRVAQVKLQFEVDDTDLQRPVRRHQNLVTYFNSEDLVLVTYEMSKCCTLSSVTTNRIRHKITLQTSYENRRKLYCVRQNLLKPYLSEKLPYVKDSGKHLIFGSQLQKILQHLMKAPEEEVNNNSSRN